MAPNLRSPPPPSFTPVSSSLFPKLFPFPSFLFPLPKPLPFSLFPLPYSQISSLFPLSKPIPIYFLKPFSFYLIRSPSTAAVFPAIVHLRLHRASSSPSLSSISVSSVHFYLHPSPCPSSISVSVVHLHHPFPSSISSSPVSDLPSPSYLQLFTAIDLQPSA
ncbi:hypothetical protein ACLOJK_037640 [Asimina triloba]